MARKAYFTVAVLAATAVSLPQPQPQPQPQDASLSIVGGENAQAGDFPYIISLRESGEHVCGGSLLDGDTVLTAAHCLGAPVSELSIRAGSLQQNTGGLEVPVLSQHPHPNYNVSTIDSDIAILKLASPIFTGNNISYATLAPPNSDPTPDTPLSTAGWGITSFDDSGPVFPNDLQRVTVPAIDRTECNTAYYPDQITQNMICAGLEEGGKDSCSRDSGGPIRDDLTGEVVGVVSWGRGCALAGSPGVYTRVSVFLDFVNGFL